MVAWLRERWATLFDPGPRIDPSTLPYPPAFTCEKCGDTYTGDEIPLASYDETRPARWTHHMVCRPLRTICRFCVMQARHDRRAEHVDRLRHKARTATKSEWSRKYQHLAANVTEFARLYGWDYDRMARDLEAAQAHRCPYCDQEFLDLPDVTLDITDPDAPPYYGTNARWICKTCNQAKGQLSPREWSIVLAIWRRRRNGRPGPAVELRLL